MEINEATVLKYGKVLARVDRGSTDGEKAAAQAAAKRMEAKHPGLRVAFMSYAARQTASGEAAHHLRPLRAATEALPTDTPFQRFLQRAAKWGADTLQDLITRNIEELAQQATGGPMASTKEIPEAVDWESDELIDLLDEHCSLESEVLIDKDGVEEDVISVELEVPVSLVEHLGDDPEKCAEFVRWLLSDDND